MFFILFTYTTFIIIYSVEKLSLTACLSDFYLRKNWFFSHQFMKIANEINVVLWLRDRPFNLQGGGVCFFVLFRIFFRTTEELEYYIFCCAKRKFFFPEFNIRLYDKNSESHCFFFSPKIRIFFSATLEIRLFFLENKLNGHFLRYNIKAFCYFLGGFFGISKDDKNQT